MDLTQQFDSAVIDSKRLPEKPDNDVLLQLYSLYKQATEGDINAEPSTNPFDFVAKAKYQAWESLKGKSREDAMKHYVSLVTQLKG
jgi:diazepam-binding inhibitor (GABA receptor modulating acyl-CoA-binding protein)